MFTRSPTAVARVSPALGLAAIALAVHALPVGAETPATRPAGPAAPDAKVAAGPATTEPVVTPAERARLKAVIPQENAKWAEWKTLLGDQSALRDPDARPGLRAKLVPLDKEIAALTNEELALRHVFEVPANKVDLPLKLASSRADRQDVLIAVGDPDSIAEAKAQAASTDKRLAIVGQLKLLGAEWLQGPDDAAQQATATKILSMLRAANPSPDWPIGGAMGPLVMNPAVVAATSEKLRHDIVAAWPNKFVVMVAGRLDREKENAQAMAGFERKPMAVAGVTVDGKPFSTEQWKGKVILVDFWASWCGPCKAELPHVKQVYHDYHDKGLEVLAVSNDYTSAALAKYLAGDPAMVWPNLFDPAAAAGKKWHPLSQQFGINSIPRMFLIDRNGVCRTVEARENMDQMIPKLLAEATPSAAAN